MKKKIRIGELIEKIIENFMVIALLGMVGLVFVNASMRYILRTGIFHSEELARFSFVWMCLLGCVVTHMKKAHIRVTILPDNLPKNAAKLINIIGRLITAGALVFLTYGAVIHVRLSSQFMNPGIPVNFAVIISVVLIMSAGMLLVDIVDFIKFIVSLVKRDKNAVINHEAKQ